MANWQTLNAFSKLQDDCLAAKYEIFAFVGRLVRN